MFEYIQTKKPLMSNIFERIMQIAGNHGYKNANELAKALGYKSPEKLYRLERNPDAKPSVDILEDISNLFENANLNWILTGKTAYTPHIVDANYYVNESESHYTPTSTRANVRPTHEENVRPTVRPTHENCQICFEKERLIEQQKETIKALSALNDMLIKRVEGLEGNQKKNAV